MLIAVHTPWTTWQASKWPPWRSCLNQKMQHSAYLSVYWLCIDADIAKYINWWSVSVQCKTQAPLLMMTRDIPNRPWEEIASDFFTFNHKDYLLICDTSVSTPSSFRWPGKQQKPPYWVPTTFCTIHSCKNTFTGNGQPFSPEKIYDL